jgi:hypothetical protein
VRIVACHCRYVRRDVAKSKKGVADTSEWGRRKSDEEGGTRVLDVVEIGMECCATDQGCEIYDERGKTERERAGTRRRERGLPWRRHNMRIGAQACKPRPRVRGHTF